MSRSTRATKPLSAARARSKAGEGLFLSLGLGELLEVRIPVEDGETLAEGLPEQGAREISSRETILTMGSILITDAVSTTVNEPLGLRKFVLRIGTWEEERQIQSGRKNR
jgi:hypothetical protein